jgi:hypothetical protein
LNEGGEATPSSVATASVATSEASPAGAPGEQSIAPRPDRGDQPRRGRRGGRRRGRRGGGGGNRIDGSAAAQTGGQADGQPGGPPDGDSPRDLFSGEGSGGPDSPPPPRESYAPPQSSSDSGDSGSPPSAASGSAEAPRTIAHFEPPPNPGRPHVVWSSAPSGSGTSRGPEE